MSTEEDRLDELVDALDELGELGTPALEYDRNMVVDGQWVDPHGTRYAEAWQSICKHVESRFAPLNYVREPRSGLQTNEDAHKRLELITVTPQDEPEVKLHVTYRVDGELNVQASFASPSDGSWELLYQGPMSEYDEEVAEQTRNKLVYIREGWMRADELNENTVLSTRESQVQALQEQDHSHVRISEILGQDLDDVETLAARIDDRIEHARNTIDMLE